MLALVMLAMLPSCAVREGRERMALVDSLITDKPDSALKLLLAMPAGQHRSGENEARYNMLLTEAVYKSDSATLPDSINPLLTDSIIGISVAYYELHGEPSDKARARYLAGIVDYENGIYDQALVNFLRADRFESGESNPKLKGLINRGIGWCLSEYYDLTSAVEYHKKSHYWFKKAGEPVFAAYELATLVSNYKSLHNLEMVEKYGTVVEQFAIRSNNQDLLTYILLVRGGLFVYLKEYEKAIKMYERIPDMNSPAINEENFMLMGTAYLIEGNVEKAMEFNTKVKTIDPAMNGIVLNKLSREKRYKELTDTLLHSLAIVDSIRNTVWTRNNIATINEYYRSEDDKNAAIAQSLRYRNWFIGISCSLLVMIVVSFYFLRTSSLKKSLYKTLSEADSLRRIVREKDKGLASADVMLSANEETIEHLNRDVHALYKDICGLNQNINRLESDKSSLENSNSELMNKLKLSAQKEELIENAMYNMQQEVHKVLISRYRQIDNLLREYNEAECSKSGHEKLFKKVKALVDDFKNNPEVIAEMERIINANMGDLITRFRKDYPRFKQTNVNMYIFLVLGISSGTIAMLQSCSVDTVYSRKSKLKRILSDSENPNAATYLSYISW